MDMVITQNPSAIYARAIEVAIGEKTDRGAVSMEIFFSENLPIANP